MEVKAYIMDFPIMLDTGPHYGAVKLKMNFGSYWSLEHDEVP